MDRYKWSNLTPLQLGRYAEYYTMMEFTMFGFDVYTSEVDDKGIDFIVRKDSNTYYDVQVKSVRNLNYTFMQKKKFILKDNLFLALVIFEEDEKPKFYLIPSFDWQLKPSKLLVNYDYEGKKSKPEWGLRLNKSTLYLLNEYEFDKVIENL